MAGTSYTRQSTLTDGDTITSALFNAEYNQLVTAFSYAATGTTGHQHDGGAGEGGNIEIIGDQDFLNKIVVDSTNNRWSVFVEVGGTAVEQVRIEDGVVYPVTDSDVDLGTNALRFKDAYIDSLTATGNLTIGGNITVTGNVDVDGIVEFDGLSGTGAVTVTDILDQDDMSGDSATALATQQSIKAYVDAQQDTVDTFGEVLALSNTTAGTDISVSTDDKVQFRDSAIYINSSADGQLDIVADTEIQIAATTVDINGAVALNGAVTGATNITLSGELDAATGDFSGAVDIDGALDVAGTTNLDVVDIDGAVDMATTLAVAGNVDFNGDLDVDGVTNLDVVDIDGAVNMATTLLVTGNVDFNGDLDVDGTTNLDVVDIDGAVDMASTLTVASNIIVGGTVDGRDVATDGTKLDGIEASADVTDTTNVTAAGALMDSELTAIASVKALNQGVATTDSPTFVDVTAASLDISGDVDVDGTLETDALTIAGVTLAETISDTVGAMVASNTETGITVTYDDADNTLDFVIGADAIVQSMIADDAIDSQMYVDGSIDTVHIADDAVTGAKLANNIDVAGTLDVTGVLTADSNVIVAGNLTVNGTTTTLNTATLDVEDKNITINYGAGDTSGSANGAGLTIQDAVDASNDATILWDTTNDEFDFSHPINVAGKVTSTGTSVFASLDISGDIDVDGTTNLDVVDIDGAVDMASTLAVGGVVTANAGVVVDNITIDGTQIDLSSGDLTLDVAGDIILDAAGEQVKLNYQGDTHGELSYSSQNFVIKSTVSDKDLIFKGSDSGSEITALTLDMSAAGAATFNNNIKTSTLLQSIGTDTQTNVTASQVIGIHLQNTSNTDGNFVPIDFYNSTDFVTARIGAEFQDAGDRNTDLYFATRANGSGLTERFRIAADGFGDYVSSANDIIRFGGANSGSITFRNDTANQFVMHTGSSDDFVIGTGGNNDRLTITSAGDATFDGAINLSGNLSFTAADGREILAKESIVVTIDSDDNDTGRVFGVRSGASGSYESLMNLSEASGATFNEDGLAALDFRVESDGNANMLFVDGGTNRVHIGTTSGTGGNLVVASNSNANGIQILARTADDYGFLNWYNAAGSSQYGAIAGTGAGLFVYGPDGSETFRTGNSGTVFNEDGSDQDFRVESDGNTHMLFVDGGNNRVGINDSSPSYPLEVNGTARIRSTLFLGSSSSDPGILSINDNSGTAYTLNLKGTGTREYTFEGSSSGGEYNLYFNNADVASGMNVHFYGGAVFNQNGDDFDFRVESDTNTHAIYVDGGNNSVTLGSSSSASNTIRTQSSSGFQASTDGSFGTSKAYTFRDAIGIDNPNASSYSTATAAVLCVGAMSTGRSINATGTVNASGADYAEYEENNGLVISKGSIVGFKADGTLTLTFSEAVRFAVKSTDPAYVGGDTWSDVEPPEKNTAAWDTWFAETEAKRAKVDRVAYSGKVPVNVQGATAGQYIIAVANSSGEITGQAVTDPDFSQYKLSVGRVNKMLEDGRAELAVIIH